MRIFWSKPPEIEDDNLSHHDGFTKLEYDILNTLHKKVFNKTHTFQDPLDAFALLWKTIPMGFEQPKLPTLKEAIDSLDEAEKCILSFLVVHRQDLEVYQNIFFEVDTGNIKLPPYNPHLLKALIPIEIEEQVDDEGVSERLMQVLWEPQPWETQPNQDIPTFLYKEE